MLVKFLFAVVLTELLTELVVKSEIFKPFRNRLPSYFFPFHNWAEKLVNCGYCFSVWISFWIVFLIQICLDLTGWYFIDLCLTSLIVHRFSNYLHNFCDKYLDKYYSLAHTSTEKEGGEF